MNDIDSIKSVAWPTPVILVHGWRPLKEGDTLVEWDTMKAALDKEKIPYYEFDYLPATGDPYAYPADLEKFIFDIRASTGYTGKFDIICHSMGALVFRFYMARGDNYKNIRQWIGIAPVNHGTAFADLIDSKRILYLLIKPFIYLYFKDIGSTGAVANMRTYDSQTIELNKSGPNHDGIMPGVIYHTILGNEVPLKNQFLSRIMGVVEWLVSSSKEEYASYQSVKEKGYLPTRMKLTRNGKTVYKWTVDGDGAVANAQSMLKNIEPIIISGVGHNDLTKDPTVIDLIIKYYKNFEE
jgi:pimeloyl-ACP methyl ester carboxylesterase